LAAALRRASAAVQLAAGHVARVTTLRSVLDVVATLAHMQQQYMGELETVRVEVERVPPLCSSRVIVYHF
jgi:hypothetical protein